MSAVTIGYCCNVHAGATWAQARAALERFVPAVRRRASPDRPMALGLWLSAESAAALAEGEGAARLRDWLLENDLRVDSLNGFPYGDFHGAAVKHAVYRPNWLDRRRLDYTRTLAELLAVLLPDGAAGAISTLPLGWRTDVTGEGALAACAVHMRELCDDLRRIEEQTGRCVHVDIEPEPGCALQGSGELVQFFERHLDRGAARDVLARYLRACHDVCHAAVCFEQQADVLARYTAAGVRVGKVQVSSAPQAQFVGGSAADALMLAALREMAEPRYLHQTVVQPAGAERVAFDDLDAALAGRVPRAGDVWRVHFHVPIFLERIGPLDTTQSDIDACLRSLPPGDMPCIEVETYAWEVLPPALRPADLADGIARELLWLESRLSAVRP